MKIYIGFSSPIKKMIGAELIKFWSETDYSHVYLRFEYQNSKDVIFHAAHGLVHFKSVANLLKENKIIKEYEIEVNCTKHELFFDECMEISGEPYSKCQLIKIFVSDVIFKLTSKVVSFNDSKGYICSELVGKLCIDELGLKFDKPTFLLKPLDIDLKLQEVYGKI